MKKLAVAIMLGLGVMVSGCGNHQQVEQAQKVECGYTHGYFGSYTASNPVQLEVGEQFGFNGSVKFDVKRINAEDHILYGVVIKDGDVGLYQVNVSGANGWDRLENKNNVYMADEVIRDKVLVADLVESGVYPKEKLENISDLGKFVNVTIVKGHIVHTHAKECK